MGYLESMSFTFRPIRQYAPRDRGLVLAFCGGTCFKPDVHGFRDPEPEIFERNAHGAEARS